MKSAVTKAASIKNFEQNLNELEAIVQALESGELSLEASLNQFEKGIKMTQQCQQALATAEQKVQILVEKNGAIELEPFTHEAE